MLEVSIATRSECGMRDHNEDALRTGREDSVCYAVLADGAGGHQGGEEAARRVVTNMERGLRDAASRFGPEALTQLVLAAHDELQRVQTQAQGVDRMHATVVAIWMDTRTDHALWTHVGDSRLYRLRHGVVDYVTTDDSVVQRMVEAGLLTPDQARHHPQKSQLIAALGIVDAVEPHTTEYAVELEDGDAYLLCSDGWWEPLDAHSIACMLEEAGSPEEWLDLMQRRIEERALPRQDNFSAIGLWVGDPAEATRIMPEEFP
ncbi:MAG TPA: protein phosphatase 2C domain-containing protein [Methylibium sp.]